MDIKNIPQNFFRVSAKALIIKKDKVLLVQEPDGRWELPGGGIDFEETPEQTLKRELAEELGAIVKKIDKKPLYVWQQERIKNDLKYYCLFLAYKTKVKSFKLKTTNEAVRYEFFNKQQMKKIKLHINIVKFSKLIN